MGEHADRQSFKGQAEFSHPGCCHRYRRLQRHTYLLFPCIPSQVFEVKCCDLAHSGVAPTDGPTSHRSGAFPLFLCLSLFVSCRDEESCFGSLGTTIKVLPSAGTPEEVGGGCVQGTKLSGSKVVITTRSWPLSAPVETTVFDCLPVFSYLPGVIHLDLTHAKSC